MCTLCGGSGWIILERAAAFPFTGTVSEAAACGCRKRAAAVPAETLDAADLLSTLGELSLLRFFPSDDSARAGLALFVAGMASNMGQVRALVDETLRLYNDWPGPAELRVVFCCLVGRPRDGIEAAFSTVYPGGVLPGTPAAGAAPVLELGPAADRLLAGVVADAAEVLGFPEGVPSSVDSAEMPNQKPAPRMSEAERAEWEQKFAEVTAARGMPPARDIPNTEKPVG